MLLQCGADPNGARSRGYRPIYIAAEDGYPEIAQVLLDAGATVDADRSRRRSPVLVAARKEHWRLVRLFLESGADLDPIRDELELLLSNCKDDELLAMIKI